MDLREIIHALGRDGVLSQTLQQAVSSADTLRAAGLEESKRISDMLDSFRRMEAEDAERRRRETAYLASLKQSERDAIAARTRFDELEALLRETHRMILEIYARLPKEG